MEPLAYTVFHRTIELNHYGTHPLLAAVGENEIVDTDQLSPANLCKIKLNLCQITHNAISSNVPIKKVTDYENIKNLKKFFMGLR